MGPGFVSITIDKLNRRVILESNNCEVIITPQESEAKLKAQIEYILASEYEQAIRRLDNIYLTCEEDKKILKEIYETLLLLA